MQFGMMAMPLVAVVAAMPALAQTYSPTKEGLRQLVADDAAMMPPPYAAKLRKQEADWEKGVGVTCTAYCFPSAKDMITTIQSHVFKMDGYVFDDVEWSASFPLPPDVKQNIAGMAGSSTPIRLDQNVPQIVAPLDARAKAFNMAMHAYVDFNWERIGGPPQSTPTDDEYDDVLLDYAPNTDNLPGTISIAMSWDDYTHGAGHGEGREEDFNWSLAENRNVVPSDIFRQDMNWQLAIAKAGVAVFANVPQYSFSQRTVENMEAALADPRSWALLRSGLRIDTSSYEVCPYMCGAPSATIPWSALKPYLKPGGFAP